ncbi:MAG: TlpA family protein disulfide reductase [Spirochaetaceae bacterium]
MEPLALGPFVIPGFALHAALALIPAFGAAWLWTRSDGDTRKTTVDLLSTALLIFVILWKLGPLVSSPALVLEEPRLLLFGRGGSAGVILGAAGAVLYLGISILRRRLFSPRLLSGLGVFAVVAAGVYGGIAIGVSAASAESSGSAGRNGRPPAPAFTLERLDGESFSLKEARGRPVVINFWATWCGPCRVEMPVKKRLAAELGDRVAFVGVNLTTSEGGVGVVRDYVEEFSIEYPIVLDARGEVQQLYGVRGTPTTYIIDADGEVVHRFMGAMSYQDMMRRLRPLLAAD